MPVTKAQAKKIARKQAGIAADDAIGLIIGTASSTLDTFGEAETAIANAALLNGGTDPSQPQTFSGFNTFTNPISGSVTGGASSLAADDDITITTAANSDGDVIFKPNNSEQMRLTAAGDLSVNNVGLKTSGTNAMIGHKEKNANAIAINQEGAGQTYLQYNEGQNLIIRENGTEHARFDSNGDLKLQHHLEIGDGKNIRSTGFINFQTGSEFLNRLMIADDGDVGIGITTPAAKLDVNGDAHIGSVGLKTHTDNNALIGQKDLGHGAIAINQGTGSTYLQYRDGHHLVIRENAVEHARFSSDGYLGIGEPNPQIPLHITKTAATMTSVQNFHTNQRLFFGFSSNGSIFGNANQSVSSEGLYQDGNAHSGQLDSILAAGCIITQRFIMAIRGTFSFSDSRIKSNITDIADDEALRLCNQLKPKRYTYTDVVNHGTSPVIGFIAQEVKDILPEAVFERADYIPNIYQLATHNGNVLEFTSSLEFSAIRDGGKIKVYDIQDCEHCIDVASACGSTITLADATQIKPEWLEESKIFVYGEQIPDVHTLKKEMIIPVAVGAIQELDRRAIALEARLDMLNQFVTNMPYMQLVQDLDARNTVLEQQVQKLTERLESLNAFTATLPSLYAQNT